MKLLLPASTLARDVFHRFAEDTGAKRFATCCCFGGADPPSALEEPFMVAPADARTFASDTRGEGLTGRHCSERLRVCRSDCNRFIVFLVSSWIVLTGLVDLCMADMIWVESSRV